MHRLNKGAYGDFKHTPDDKLPFPVFLSFFYSFNLGVGHPSFRLKYGILKVIKNLYFAL